MSDHQGYANSGLEGWRKGQPAASADPEGSPGTVALNAGWTHAAPPSSTHGCSTTARGRISGTRRPKPHTPRIGRLGTSSPPPSLDKRAWTDGEKRDILGAVRGQPLHSPSASEWGLLGRTARSQPRLSHSWPVFLQLIKKPDLAMPGPRLRHSPRENPGGGLFRDQLAKTIAATGGPNENGIEAAGRAFQAWRRRLSAPLSRVGHSRGYEGYGLYAERSEAVTWLGVLGER